MLVDVAVDSAVASALPLEHAVAVAASAGVAGRVSMLAALMLSECIAYLPAPALPQAARRQHPTSKSRCQRGPSSIGCGLATCPRALDLPITEATAMFLAMASLEVAATCRRVEHVPQVEVGLSLGGLCLLLGIAAELSAASQHA